MLLTITTTHQPASDLGFLLHKHPDRCQSFDLSFGQAHVFYPECNETQCSATLLLNVDPIGLVRNRRGPAGEGAALQQYVNDRPYVVSSFMSVAIAQVYGSALGGRCKVNPSLTEAIMPLHATLAVLPCQGGDKFMRELFEPLGYAVEALPHELDDHFPEWGNSPYYTVTLTRNCKLSDLLTHLYVLIPVLDNEKHYWVGDDEVEKLLRHGEGWLANHPLREVIAKRYLRYQGHLTRDALSRLADEDQPDPDATAISHDQEEKAAEDPIRLNELRMAAVLSELIASNAATVIDLGCGEGRLLKALLEQRQFESIVGVDVSVRALEIAGRRLKLDRMPDRQRQRIKLLHGSLMYRDSRLNGFDAASVVEVIEHLDPPRLRAFERVVFEFARPRTVIVTTPNVEYNSMWESLPAGQFRHRDHRFEWTRSEFQQWSNSVADRFGYRVRFAPIGPDDPDKGAPTQMAVFQQ